MADTPSDPAARLAAELPRMIEAGLLELKLYAAANGVSLERARYELEVAKQRGRTPSACALPRPMGSEEPDP